MSAGDWKEMLTAVQNGNLTLVKYHIEKGINPNYQHPELLTTPLIESITYERYAITKFLLENGANPSLKAGFSTDTPLVMAKRTKNIAIINLIKSYLPKKKSILQKILNKLLFNRCIK